MKKLASFLLCACLLIGIGSFAYADSYGGTVSFDGKNLNSDYSMASLTDAVSAMQPGDELTISIVLKNAYTASADWWMTNKVLDSFEDNSIAKGGAYQYRLTYTGPNGVVNTLYDSETVGGETEKNEGLREATSSLENYFYVDTLTPNQSGVITLYIALDGETQGNNYQNTLADITMNFAVELTKGSSTVVKTGDDTVILPYLGISAITGLALLIYSLVLLTKEIETKRGRRAA